MLTDTQKFLIKKSVNESLDLAEHHWKNGGHELSESYSAEAKVVINAMDSAPSKIPGHPIVKDNVTVIDEFIAYVADMRHSSEHLLCAISEKNADVSMLQRVYYETSALLPALALTVGFEGGNVTEYLGDGILALFKVDTNSPEKAIYAAHRASKNSIGDARNIVNGIINDRYRLPELDLGVGLAMSKALVTLVGLEGDKHPKAIGSCVFKATKLSGGQNEVIIDEVLKTAWPTAEKGVLKFKDRNLKGTTGYLIQKNK